MALRRDKGVKCIECNLLCFIRGKGMMGIEADSWRFVEVREAEIHRGRLMALRRGKGVKCIEGPQAPRYTSHPYLDEAPQALRRAQQTRKEKFLCFIKKEWRVSYARSYEFSTTLRHRTTNTRCKASTEFSYS